MRPSPQGLSRGKRARSRTSERRPRRARWSAVAEPARLPPTMTTSASAEEPTLQSIQQRVAEGVEKGGGDDVARLLAERSEEEAREEGREPLEARERERVPEKDRVRRGEEGRREDGVPGEG